MWRVLQGRGGKHRADAAPFALGLTSARRAALPPSPLVVATASPAFSARVHPGTTARGLDNKEDS